MGTCLLSSPSSSVPNTMLSLLVETLFFAASLSAVAQSVSPSGHNHKHLSTDVQGSAQSPILYKRNITLIGPHDYLQFFNIAAIPDPSGGAVQYVNQSEARRLDLYGTGKTGGFRFGADLSEANITGTGRKSLRLESYDAYGEGLYVFHVKSGPSGCGTWPAMWTYGALEWPTHGEIDVLEWTNGRRKPNGANIHTGLNCTMPGDEDNRYYSGESQGILDCDSVNGKNGNMACGIDMTRSPLSAGLLHNRNGGGYHVMERMQSTIKVWFFTECSAPQELRQVKTIASLTTANFGKPDARFPTTATCDIATHINRPHTIVLNIDFCGLAQAYWEAEGCLALAPDCASWTATPDATAYYKGQGRSVEFDIESMSIFAPS